MRRQVNFSVMDNFQLQESEQAILRAQHNVWNTGRSPAFKSRCFNSSPRLLQAQLEELPESRFPICRRPRNLVRDLPG
jgi:hypothetical protein